jgi:putative ABC transport system substrate-binding protein
MRRREFIKVIAGSGFAWPLIAHAQQGERMRTVGVLMNFAADDPEGPPRAAALAQGMQELGWTVGRNLRIEYRWSAGDAEANRGNAAELVALPPDVIIAGASPAMMALQQATSTVPVVFLAVTDPVGAGYVASLSRPGGNATGFVFVEYGISGKWLELLKEIAPRALCQLKSGLRSPRLPQA